MNVHEKVQDVASGSGSARIVAGCRIPACAAESSGVPASTNRFQSGTRPFATAS